MRWCNSRTGYGPIQIVLHWLMAIMLIGLVPLGLWMTGLDYYHPWYRDAPDLHRAIGVLLAIVLLLRITWRLSHRAPAPLARQAWEKRAAATAHLLLYLLPAALVISGYLLSTADGRSVDVFGWFEVPALIHGHDGQEDIAGEIHFILAMILIGVVALHVMAALRHHFTIRDDTLRRMLKPLDNTVNRETRHDPVL